MFDKGFGADVRALLAALRSKDRPARAVLAAATLSPPVRKLLAAQFGEGLVTVQTSSFHRAPASGRHEFLPVGDGDKLALLRDAVAAATARGRSAIVFCNTVPSARAAGHALDEWGAGPACVHGDVPGGARAAAIAAFCDASSAANSTSGRGPVMVATDLAARGLDLARRVDAVINFDFPRSATDYVHRAGRTARAGAPGSVVSLVTGKDRTLADRVRAAVSGGHALDGVTGAKGAVPAFAAPSAATRARREAEAQAARAARRGRRGAARLAEPAAPAAGRGGLRGGRAAPRQRSTKR
jgi:superfamily II DNA/RNA helicase